MCRKIKAPKKRKKLASPKAKVLGRMRVFSVLWCFLPAVCKLCGAAAFLFAAKGLRAGHAGPAYGSSA